MSDTPADRWDEHAARIREVINVVYSGSDGTSSYLVEDALRKSAESALAALRAERDAAETQAAKAVEKADRKERDFLKMLEASATEFVRAEAAEARVEQLTEALRDLIGACAPPVEALTAVHADGKYIAPETLDALLAARDELRARAVLAGDSESAR